MKRYALVIGISNYRSGSGLNKLSKPAIDAEQFAQRLEQHGDFEVKRLPEYWVSSSSCRVCETSALNYEQLTEELRKFLSETAANHEAVIYFSGHGYVLFNSLTGKAQEGFLAASDCEVEIRERRVVRHNQNSISLRSLSELVADSKVSSLVMILDCCHAGSLLEQNIVRTTLTALNAAEKSYFFLAACRRAEGAYEGEELSLFTEALLEALQPEQARTDGWITCDRIFSVVDELLKGKGQEPIRMSWGQSITLIRHPPKILSPVRPIDEACPYQGLKAFDQTTAQFFFGREQVTETLRQKLDQGNLIPVIGASGSGKSSVVKAGLIPRLEREGWGKAIVFCPSIEPLTALKQALQPLFRPESLAQVYDWIETGISESAIGREFAAIEPRLLVVDQFEEVFTQCRPGKEHEQKQFIQRLTDLAEAPHSKLKVVITLRADFVEHCLQHDILANLLNQNRAVFIQTLRSNELRDAILKPAEVQGYQVDEDLLNAILEDFRSEAVSLPLLQFTLTKLWQPATEQGHRLTLAQYNKLERIEGTLNLHAQEIYRGIVRDFGQQAEIWVKQIFLNLVHAGREMKDTRQRQPKDSLLSLLTDNSEELLRAGQILERLTKGRLLTMGKEVDLAHEVLMEGWETFVRWREEERELLRLRDRINEAYQEWLENDRDNAFLITTGRLTQITKLWSALQHYLPSQVQEFYRLSLEHEQTQRSFETTINQLLENQLKNLETQIFLSLDRMQSSLVEPFTDTQATGLAAPEYIKLSELQGQVQQFPQKANRFMERMRSSQLAVNWLTTNQEKLSQLILGYITSAANDELWNVPETLSLVYREIQELIEWLKASLIKGEPIDETLERQLTLTKSIYAEALKFFKRECLPSELPDASVRELRRYVQYLIEYLDDLLSD